MWEFLQKLTDPNSIIEYGGLWLLLFVIFAETGLLVGFFLPGDNLILLAGILCKARPDLMHVTYGNVWTYDSCGRVREHDRILVWKKGR